MAALRPNYSTSEDCARTLSACAPSASRPKELPAVRVDGVGTSGFSAPEAALDCGNSGTTMRFWRAYWPAGFFFDAHGRRVSALATDAQGDRASKADGRRSSLRAGHAPSASTGASAHAHQLPVTVPSAQLSPVPARRSQCARSHACDRKGGQNADHTERMLRCSALRSRRSKSRTATALSEALAVEGPASLIARAQYSGDIHHRLFIAAAALCRDRNSRLRMSALSDAQPNSRSLASSMRM